jgi:hypothetical protein
MVVLVPYQGELPVSTNKAPVEVTRTQLASIRLVNTQRHLLVTKRSHTYKLGVLAILSIGT